MKVWIAVLSVALLLLSAVFAVYWFFFLGVIRSNNGGFAANHNDMATVQAEIDSADFREFLGRAAHLRQWRVRHYKAELFPSYGGGTVTHGVNDALVHALSLYVSCRAEGHSAVYSRDAVALGDAPVAGEPEYITAIRKEYRQTIVPKWIHHTETISEPDGGRATSVVVLDGELALLFEVWFGNDDSVKEFKRTRIDEVEFSPAYLSVIAEVEEQVDELVKAVGVNVRADWEIKKDLLKEKGIIWRSHAEMNSYNDRFYY